MTPSEARSVPCSIESPRPPGMDLCYPYYYCGEVTRCAEGTYWWTGSQSCVPLDLDNKGEEKDPIDPNDGGEDNSTSSTSSGSSTGGSTSGGLGLPRGSCTCPDAYTCGGGAMCKMQPSESGGLIGYCVDPKTMNPISTSDTQKCISNTSSGSSGSSTSSTSSSTSSSSGAGSSSGSDNSCARGYTSTGDGTCCPVNGVGPCYSIPSGSSSTGSSSTGGSSTSSSSSGPSSSGGGSSGSGGKACVEKCLSRSDWETCTASCLNLDKSCEDRSGSSGGSVESSDCTDACYATYTQVTGGICQNESALAGRCSGEVDETCPQYQSCVRAYDAYSACSKNCSTPPATESSGGVSFTPKTFRYDMPAGESCAAQGGCEGSR